MGKKRELVKNTAIITVGKLCTQFLSFFLLPVYTAVLSTSEYGTFDLLMVYQQLIGYVAFFQIEQDWSGQDAHPSLGVFVILG